MDGGAWWAAVHGVAKSRTQLSDFTFTFHFHALEKEMATHSSVPAWRIPGMGEPGGLPSMGLHRVGHDWSDLAAATTQKEHSLVHVWLRKSHILAVPHSLSNNSSGHSERSVKFMNQYIQSTHKNLWGSHATNKESHVCTDMCLSPQLLPPQLPQGDWDSGQLRVHRYWDSASSYTEPWY